MSRDPEFWFPANEKRVGRVGRPKVRVTRRLEDFPPPNPQPTPCRLWQGAIDQDGYGILSNHQDRVRWRAHRWIWVQKFGPIPDGLVVRHKCDNRLCYRTSHLELGTVADNVDDARQRGHLGPARKLPPSAVREIWRRHEAGESYPKIATDYPEFSLATIKRVKDYIHDVIDEAEPEPHQQA